MTPQEAIQNLNQECAIAQHRCGCKINRTDCESCYIWTAIKALKKQIPQKPNVKKWVALDDAVYTYHCPHCDVDYNKYYIGSHHCKFCGQAIDWSDTDE